MEKKNFEYNSEIDSLYISSSKNEEITTGSIVVNNLIFDISSSGNLVGLEIDNASQVLKLKPSNLSKGIKQAEISMFKEGKVIFLRYNVETRIREVNSSYIIPQNRIAIKC